MAFPLLHLLHCRLEKKITLYIYLNQKILTCKAVILYMTWSDLIQGKMFVHGAKFEGLSQEDRDVISLYCFNTILPRFQHKFGKKPSLFLKMLSKFYNKERFRKYVRRRLSLPLIVQNNENTSLAAVTNDISMSGLSFTSYVPFELGTILTMEVFTPSGTLAVEGEVRQIREIKAGYSSYIIGVKFTQFFDRSENILFDRFKNTTTFAHG